MRLCCLLKDLICAFSFLWDAIGVGNSCCDKSRLQSKHRLLDVLDPYEPIRHCSLSFSISFTLTLSEPFQWSVSPSPRRLITALWPFSCSSRIYLLSTISIVTTYRLPERSLIYPAAPWQKVSAHQRTEPNKLRADCISRPFFSSSMSVVLCDGDWDGKQAHYLGGTLSITPSASWSSRPRGVPGSWIIPAQVADFAPRLFACHL